MITFWIVYALIALAFLYPNYYILQGHPEYDRVFAVFVVSAAWPIFAWLTIYCWIKYGLNK